MEQQGRLKPLCRPVDAAPAVLRQQTRRHLERQLEQRQRAGRPPRGWGALWLLLALLAGWPTVGAATACTVPVFIVKDECKAHNDTTKGGHRCIVWENRYLMDVVLAQLPAVCGCHIQLHDRPKAVPAMHAMAQRLQQQEGRDQGGEAVMILVARLGLNLAERRAVHSLTAFTRQSLVVIHLGDEKAMKPHDLLWYPHVRAVFRNYHQDVPTLANHMRYLTRTLPDSQQPQPNGNSTAWWAESVSAAHREAMAAPHVHWFPLGFGESFLTSAAWRAPLEARPLLWSWVGSTHRKWERIEMVRQLAVPELLGHGFLQELQGGFRAPTMQSPMRYSDLLHQTVLVPMPQGVACEQFRLYEAIAAGAVPVIAAAHRDSCMAHVALMGFKVLWVGTWKEARPLMLGVLRNATQRAELAEWQAHNLARYRHVMDAVGQQLAEVTCGGRRSAGGTVG